MGGSLESWGIMGKALGTGGARVALGGLWLTMRPWRTMVDHGGVMGLWGVLKDHGRWFGVIRNHWAVGIMGTMGDWWGGQLGATENYGRLWVTLWP